MFRTALVIAFLAIGGGILPAQGQELAGQYHTTFVNDGLPQPVWLTLQSLSAGQKGTSLSYSRPRSCTLHFEYGGEVNGELFLYVRSWDGGRWCRDKSDKDVLLKVFPQNGRDVRYDLIIDKNIIESQVASRQ
jgi:hypothetical protein